MLNPTQEYDLYNTASIEASVRHSDVVYNLIGRDYPTKYVDVIGEFSEWRANSTPGTTP